MICSLVTGGAGFIGAHVAQQLLKMGHKVVIVDDLSGGFLDNVPPKATFIQGDISCPKTVAHLFEQYQFTYIYHLAAYAAEGLSHFIRRFNYQNNLLASVHLINAAVKQKKPIKCFVFTSSIAVYGTNVLPMIESANPMPEDPYGIAKYAVELDLKAAQEMFGLNYIIFRPHNVFGEYQNIGDKYRNVIGIFMNQLLQGKPLSIYGDGQQTRAFSYIDNIAPYIANSVNIAEAQNQVFNIGSDEHYTVQKLAHLIMDAMNIKGELQYLPARKEVIHAYADHQKIKQVFKGQNTQDVSIEEGLQRMATWVKKQGARKTKAFKDIEIYENLPQNWL